MDQEKFRALIIAAHDLITEVNHTNCALPASVFEKLAAVRKTVEPLIDTLNPRHVGYKAL